MSESIAPPTHPTLLQAKNIAVAEAARPIAPLTGGQRLVEIDFLRGMALLGIILVNAAFFFGPVGRAMDQSWLVSEPTVDQVAWSAVDALCSFKFISLFSMMFGFGIALQMHRVDQAHGSAWGFARRRFGLLLVIGLLHGLFIWFGDILFIYGAMGFVLTLMRKLSPKTLLIVAGCIAGVIALLAAAGMLLGLVGAHYMGEFAEQSSPETVATGARGFDAILSSEWSIMSPIWMDAEIAAYSQGPLGDVLLFRALTWAFFAALSIVSYGWHVLCMMLLGMWAYKVNFWSPELSLLRRRVALVSLSVGLPISLAGVLLVWVGGFDQSWTWAVHGLTLQLGALILPAGYAVAIAACASMLPQFITKAVAAAGRMALTTYLLESVCATTLSYWWGFAWFGRVGPAQQIVAVVLIWVVLVVAARIWLRVYPMGPVEWVWRAFTYLTLHPTRATSR